MILGQTLSSLPQMQPGTDVRVVSQDLLSVYAGGTVTDDGELLFKGSLEGAGDVRLLFYPPDDSGQRSEAVHITGSVSPDGQDILLELDGREEPLSFREWLQDERGLILRIPR